MGAKSQDRGPRHPSSTLPGKMRVVFLSKEIDYLYVGISLCLTVVYFLRIVMPIIRGTADLYAAIFSAYGLVIYAVIGVLFFVRVTPKSFAEPKDMVAPLISFVAPALMTLLGGYLEAAYSYPYVAIPLFIAGCALTVASFGYLGPGFGIFPALRMVTTRGPYRVIRHPAYLGETLYILGIVLHRVNWLTVILFVVTMAATIVRIIIEEKILSASPEYKEYRKRTRYRLVPGLW